MSFFASLIGSDSETQQDEQRREVARDQLLLAELRQELQKFERLIRIFEVTYLELSALMQDKIKQMNMQEKPRELSAEFRINQRGQIILADAKDGEQMLDQHGSLIDAEARVVRRACSKSRSPNKRETSRGSSNGRTIMGSTTATTRQVISLNSMQQRSKSGKKLQLSLSPSKSSVQ